MKFRRKPIVIEAEQFFHKGDAGVTLMWGKDEAEPCECCGRPISEHGKVPTLYRSCRMAKRYHTACPGDWIVIGVMGEKYPLKPDIFELAYEPVVEK